ncbi:hypothetical protein Acsp04_46710 [Actinomadura sp. NBRC 104425]|uniref:hypothetical protein n=1 Tax=Actinomadura sp. NBRC 104425 TaxID=3032204 RepID=UPI0024A484FB|nr:hypothetical protein [Actinomadura sp. NBRC 104425]GLZ14436.1 hypothetical protein Acsp04_46710 [Actinomadura sp. NBRC 104425]
MKKINAVLAAAAFTILALFAAPGAAQATVHSSPGSAAAAAPDGYLYAWQHKDRGGYWCRWFGNDANWSTCSGSSSSLNMRNVASSLENRGYAGAYEDVDLFYHPNYTGSNICLWNGRYLNNLTGIYFPWDGKDGQGQSTNDNIASHRWSNNC